MTKKSAKSRRGFEKWGKLLRSVYFTVCTQKVTIV